MMQTLDEYMTARFVPFEEYFELTKEKARNDNEEPPSYDYQKNWYALVMRSEKLHEAMRRQRACH